MQLMDVVTVYLYGDLDTKIDMKVPKELPLTGSNSSRPWNTLWIETILADVKSHSGFAIVAVYVDDMNLIGTAVELKEIAAHLKSDFEMKDLGKTRYCLCWRLSIVQMES
ncbi:uncharacterized protein [Malus domestica]|uniref:uncharacterized protein n=1 Tax=Malus domestica TaxID=3750 RepID=UPI00397688A7